MTDEAKIRQPPPPRPDRPLLITPKRSFLNLLDLLRKRKVVAVDEAAKIVGASAEEIEDYAQRYPKHFLWFGGPTPTISLAVEAPPHPQLSAQQQASLERLIRLAEGCTDQSRHIANFLLAWWNAKECGGFDLTELWAVDPPIGADMAVVFGLVAGRHLYPDNFGYGEQFGRIIAAWRSDPDRPVHNQSD